MRSLAVSLRDVFGLGSHVAANLRGRGFYLLTNEEAGTLALQTARALSHFETPLMQPGPILDVATAIISAAMVIGTRVVRDYQWTKAMKQPQAAGRPFIPQQRPNPMQAGPMPPQQPPQAFYPLPGDGVLETQPYAPQQGYPGQPRPQSGPGAWIG